MKLLSTILKACAEYIHIDRDAFITSVQEVEDAKKQAEQSQYSERLRVAQTRAGELEKLICRIYEDHVLDKIPDERYEALDSQYTQELQRMKAEISVCEAALSEQSQRRGSAARFAALFDKYQDFSELTPAMIHQLVEKIVVHEREIKGSQTSPQQIDIYFNFVGYFVPPTFGQEELTPEQIIEQERAKEQRERFKRRYQRRKANGKQKEYEDRTRERHKAVIDAKKEVMRAEIIAEGIYTPVQPILTPQRGVVGL